MNSRQQDHFRKILTEQLESLVNAGGETLLVIMENGSPLPDPTDRATFETDRDVQLLIRTRESRLINKIRAALERIEDGTFGICEICEEDISIRRLEARPVTTQCIDCKTRSEAMEKSIFM